MGYTHYWDIKDVTQADWDKAFPYLQKICEQHKDIICYEHDQPSKPYLLDKEEIRFNGKDEDGHEIFLIDYKDSSSDDFCKTDRKPYDLVVCKVLWLLKLLWKDKFELKSDGKILGDDSSESWHQARLEVADLIIVFPFEKKSKGKKIFKLIDSEDPGWSIKLKAKNPKQAYQESLQLLGKQIVTTKED